MMIKKLLFLFALFFVFSCQKEKELTLPGLAKVELLSYPDRMIWDTISYEKKGFFYKELADNGKLNFDTTMVKERLILNPNQIKELTTLLEGTCSEEEAVAACYMPRHMILFRDKNNKIIAYNEFCFGCVGSRNSKNLEGYQNFCMSDMAQLFEKFGIKYFGDTPEQEREESKFADSIIKARHPESATNSLK